MTRQSQEMALLVSSKTTEWYTPMKYIMMVKKVLGGIDCDPCTSESAQRYIRATTYYTKDTDGLKHDWHGTVFINPPYGKTGNIGNQRIWTEYLVNQLTLGHTTVAIALCKSVPGYSWYEQIWDCSDAQCLVRLPISFINPRQPTKRSPSKAGTTFFYFANDSKYDPRTFRKVFRKIGRVYITEESDWAAHE